MSGKVQSAKQRKANEAFARKEDAKRGKPTRASSKKAIKRTNSQKFVIGKAALEIHNTKPETDLQRVNWSLNLWRSSLPVSQNICMIQICSAVGERSPYATLRG
jgi:hypothetical protein